MHLLARLRWHLARSPWIGRTLVAMAALATWSSVRAAGTDATTAAEQWGERITVWSTTRATRRGEVIVAEQREIPAALLPDGALTDAPVGKEATHDLAQGEIVVAIDVAEANDVDRGSVVMSIPAEFVPSLLAGDRVAVFGSGELLCNGIAASGPTVVDGRPVVEVAVDADCAADLSAHLVAGATALGRLT